MASSFSTTVTAEGRLQPTFGSRLGGPYVAMTSIDLRLPQTQVEVLLYGAWQSADPDDDADVVPLIWRDGVWELNLPAPPMERTNDVVFLVALIEHFDGEPRAFKSIIRNALLEAADASVHLARRTRVARLIGALDRTVDRANGGPNFTSFVEVALSADDITLLETYGSCRFVRSFCGYGGQHCLGIELKAASKVWTLTPGRHEAFAWAAA